MPTLAENLNENFNFFVEQDLRKFSGKWIAIINKKVIDSSDNLKKLMEDVKSKYPKEEPLIVRAPVEKALIL